MGDRLMKKRNTSEFRLSYLLLLSGYVLLPVITPNFYTLDSSGTKFLSICLLNLIAFLVFFIESLHKHRCLPGGSYWKNPVIIAYSLFLVFTLLSFLSTINLKEAVLTEVKIITIFSSVTILFVIFRSNRNYINYMATALSVLLIIDAMTVFYNILSYLERDIKSISDIVTVYSNKNILASALFVKIPASLFLIFFTRGWQRKLGYWAGFCAVLATLLMSTRTFYLGLVILLVAMSAFSIARYVAIKERSPFSIIVRWAGLFILALGLFTFIQQFLFPKNEDLTYNVDFISRISTISNTSMGSSGRLDCWKRTLTLIGDHPLTGVGIGNWKVAVLKYENQATSHFSYLYKNHNDFLEVAAETGIAGGLTYVSVFLLIMVGFARTCLKAEKENPAMKYLFLPAFGILAYSVDAFFNFPADRPEIQALFALYVGSAVADVVAPADPVNKAGDMQGSEPSGIRFNYPALTLLAVLVLHCAMIWLLCLNVKSLRYQRYVKEDLNMQAFTHPASSMLAGFPCFPDLTVVGEPVAVSKARYLLNDRRFQETINMMSADRSSPFDSRRELFLAMAYQSLGMTDSAVYWGRLAVELKPYNALAVNLLSSLLWEKGQRKEAVQLLDTILLRVKNFPDAWMRAANYRIEENRIAEALVLLDSAIIHLPNDTNLVSKREKIKSYYQRATNEDLFNKAFKAFSEKKHRECIVLLDDFINRHPESGKAYEMRAYCFYFTGKYERSIEDINLFLRQGGVNYDLLNLRGLQYRLLGKSGDACRDFKTAMDNGNHDASVNYNKFCIRK